MNLILSTIFICSCNHKKCKCNYFLITCCNCCSNQFNYPNAETLGAKKKIICLYHLLWMSFSGVWYLEFWHGLLRSQRQQQQYMFYMTRSGHRVLYRREWGGGRQTGPDLHPSICAICSVEICMPQKAIKLKYTVIVPFWDRRHTNAYCMCL